jgi:hypothetical protein
VPKTVKKSTFPQYFEPNVWRQPKKQSEQSQCIALRNNMQTTDEIQVGELTVQLVETLAVNQPWKAFYGRGLTFKHLASADTRSELIERVMTCQAMAGNGHKPGETA